MTFDKQEHKDALIALFNQASFPGSLAETAAELKRALDSGAVVKPEKPQDAD